MSGIDEGHRFLPLWLPGSSQIRRKLPAGFLGASFLLAALGAGAAFFSFKVTDRASESRLLCDEVVWDFGSRRQDKPEPLTHTFRLENSSNEAIRISDVLADCGCIVADNHPKEVGPKSAVDLAVAIKLPGHPGPIRKHVNVVLETSPVSKLQLVIQGRIAPTAAFYLVPEKLNFGILDQNEVKSRRVRIARYEGSPVRLLQATPQSDALRVTSVGSGDGLGSFVELAVSLDASTAQTGEFRSKIDVITAHAGYRDIKIPVVAKIKAEPHGLVESILIDRLPKGAFRDISLVVQSGHDVVVEYVSYDGDGRIALEALTADETDNDRRTITAVRVLRSGEFARPSVVRGTLEVKLADRALPVRIPMTVYVPN